MTEDEQVVEGPRALYRERLAAREASLAALERRDGRFSTARFGCFLAFLLLVGAGWQLGWSLWVLLIPVLAFVVLASLHERVIQARDRAARAVAHYRDGLERLADRWAGKGATGTDYLSGEHPYAADLDIFGAGSLFDLLCRARTRAGEERLAQWLCVHAEQRVSAEQVRARQAAVRSLIEATQLREDLAVLGTAARVQVRPAALIDWGRAPGLFPAKMLRWLPAAGIVLPLLVAAGCVAWWLGPWWAPYVLGGVVVVEGMIYRALGSVLERVMGIIDRQGRELGVLAALLERVERGEIEDPSLASLAKQLGVDGSELPASQAIAELHRLTGWYEAQRSGLFFPIALVLMWGPNFALAIERWRLRHGPRIAVWIDALAELEALSSLAGYAFEQPDAVFPELVEPGKGEGSDATPLIEGEGLGHPLLPRTSCVRNDLSLVTPVRAHVISGSNMSGKSTFLRTVGTNVVLALAGAPVCARSMRLSPVRIGATMRVQDSLQEGASRFWAELVRLRVISELAAEGPTLFLLDEIFHGTNSHDRRIGAEALLRKLLEHGAVGLLTTHDLALAQAAEALAPAATNVHFEDQLRDGELSFDYRMREGVVRKSNALALMRSVGLEL